jgi:hypothetical protein
MDLNKDIYDQLEEQAQAKLNAAGLSDVTVKIGWFRVADHLRLEARGRKPAKRKPANCSHSQMQNESRPARRELCPV